MSLRDCNGIISGTPQFGLSEMRIGVQQRLRTAALRGRGEGRAQQE